MLLSDVSDSVFSQPICFQKRQPSTPQHMVTGVAKWVWIRWSPCLLELSNDLNGAEYASDPRARAPLHMGRVVAIEQIGKHIHVAAHESAEVCGQYENVGRP